jgi:outer membrane autotransporter protein
MTSNSPPVADLEWRHRADYDLGTDFDGSMYGVQVGADVYRRGTDSGGSQQVGAYYGYSELSGDVSGNVLLQTDVTTGTMDMEQHAFGIYWTRIEPSGWYFDAVAQYALLETSTTSEDDVTAETSGHGYALSFELGRNIPLNDVLSIEPQGQLLWQRLNFDSTSDGYSDIDFSDIHTLTGRIGRTSGASWRDCRISGCQPYRAGLPAQF